MKLAPRMIPFERARDGAGQFAPQAASGGADPSTMAAAYPGTQRNMGNAATVASAGGTAATALMVARKLRARR